MKTEDIIKKVEDLKHKPKTYRHVCSGGNSFNLMDFFSENEISICHLAGTCQEERENGCDRKIKGRLSLYEREEYENYAFDKVIKMLRE